MSKPGLIRFYYDHDSRPDTRTDVLSFGFITPAADAVILRVDSETSDDYVEAEIVAGNVFVSYNLGTEDVAIGETNVKVSDGIYHVLRFTRSGQNSTLQLDDNQMQTKHPQGKPTTTTN